MTDNVLDFMELPHTPNAHIKKGDFLLSSPFLREDNFLQSVIFICDHEDTEGTLGFILNRPLKLQVSSLVSLPENTENLSFGGPVNPTDIFFLHTIPAIENSIAIKDGVYYGGSFAQLKILSQQNKLHQNNIRFFIGYSGWGKFQLKSELQEKSWIVSKLPVRTVFEGENDALWNKILYEMGGKYKIFSNYPRNPHLN